MEIGRAFARSVATFVALATSPVASAAVATIAAQAPTHGFALHPASAAAADGAPSSSPSPPWCDTVDHAAFVLEPDETLHPSLPASGFAARFVGDVRCVAAGDYRFHVELRGGDVTLELVDRSNGENKSTSRVTGVASVTKRLSNTLHLDQPGSIRVQIDFARDGDAAARLKLSWELAAAGPANFGVEPLPSRLVTPPPETESSRGRAALAARGRVALVELGCTNCHDAEKASSLLPRRGAIDLAVVGERVEEEWLRRWITAPQSMAPGSGMPDLLRDVEPRELSDLLAMLRGKGGFGAAPIAESSASSSLALIAEGRALYHSIGCVACHGARASPAVAFGDASLDPTAPAAPAAVPFGDVAGKWRVAPLARFLLDPAALRTHGRMPSFALSEVEATALARYLVEEFGGGTVEESAEKGVPLRDPNASLGIAVARKHRCDRCHTMWSEPMPMERAPQPAPVLAALDASRGCLAASDETRGAAPRYDLSREQRDSLVAALAQVAAAAAPAPLTRARDLVAALRCDACHGLQGGARVDGVQAADYFRCGVAADLGDEGRLPPRLDGVGSRLQSPWLEKVIGDGARARPYMATRMPRFGAAIAGELARGLAVLEGEWRSDDPVSSVATRDEAPRRAAGDSDESLAVVGRQLAGSGGMNCITCHSFGERPSAGTPGLDFLQFRERLRPEAFAAYARAPARFKPGTRMPRYFEEGKSVVEGVLDGDPARQIDALWCWFERAASMPAPEGVPTGEKQLLAVGDRPVVFRSFMERAGVRGIAIGTPAGLHFAFDAEQVRLVEAWSGDFLDVAPVWDGRGGGVAIELGPVAWSAPPGPLLALESLETAPTSTANAARPRFLGYRLEPDGTPTFLWTLAGRGAAIEVDEQFLPDPRPDVFFLRKLTIRGASKEHPVWLAKLGDRATFFARGAISNRKPELDFSNQIANGHSPDLGRNESLSLAPQQPGGVIRLTLEIR